MKSAQGNPKQDNHCQRHRPGWLMSACMGVTLLALTSGARAEAAPTFSDYLTKGYRELAAHASERVADSRAAQYFAAKAEQARLHQRVEPEWPGAEILPVALQTEALSARQALMTLLDRKAGEKAPRFAAAAQVNFDCWLAQFPESDDGPDSGDCRKSFYRAIGALVGVTVDGPVTIAVASPSEPAGSDLEGMTIAEAGPTPLSSGSTGNSARTTAAPGSTLTVVWVPLDVAAADPDGADLILIVGLQGIRTATRAILAGYDSGDLGSGGISAVAGDNAEGGGSADPSAEGGSIGASLGDGDSSGNGGLVGASVGSGDSTGNGGLVGVSAGSGDSSGNGGLVGASAGSGDSSGNGGLVGASVGSGDSSGNGGLVGASVGSGSDSGNGGLAGAAIGSGSDSGNGGLVGVSAGSDGVRASVGGQSVGLGGGEANSGDSGDSSAGDGGSGGNSSNDASADSAGDSGGGASGGSGLGGAVGGAVGAVGNAVGGLGGALGGGGRD
jgi:hypothetical protein